MQSKMLLSLTESKNGVLVPVRVKPRARSNSIEGVRDGAILLCVTAAPSDGEANHAVIKTLAKELNLARSSLELVRGHKSREKTVAVIGVSRDELQTRLAALLPSD